jgi:hypothetical protein
MAVLIKKKKAEKASETSTVCNNFNMMRYTKYYLVNTDCHEIVKLDLRIFSRHTFMCISCIAFITRIKVSAY